MDVPYAEVIGDPIDHSLSPAIHRFWLDKLGLPGDYRATRCTVRELPAFLKRRCGDPYWRGCNVTAPLKAEAARRAADPTGICARIGAANAIFRSPLGCGVVANTDILGIAAALGEAHPAKAVIIGAGGAARAALEVVGRRQVDRVTLLVRDPRRVAWPATLSLDLAHEAFDGADCVINATPLGMRNGPPMPETVVDALANTAPDALVFDMVYAPFETALVRRARETDRRIVDGITLLIGQAGPAFELFFGAPAPREHDFELRERLTS